MRYKKIALQLWKLLDDIDTAGDAYKPKINGYYRYILGKAKDRFNFMGSNGYKVKKKWRKVK